MSVQPGAYRPDWLASGDVQPVPSDERNGGRVVVGERMTAPRGAPFAARVVGLHVGP